MKEEQNITIRIADQSPFPMTIRREDEETIRIAERNVNQLYRLMKERFTGKSPVEVMAIVAFQFARQLYGQEAAIDAVSKSLTDYEQELDKLLVNIGE